MTIKQHHGLSLLNTVVPDVDYGDGPRFPKPSVISIKIDAGRGNRAIIKPSPLSQKVTASFKLDGKPWGLSTSQISGTEFRVKRGRGR